MIKLRIRFKLWPGLSAPALNTDGMRGFSPILGSVTFLSKPPTRIAPDEHSPVTYLLKKAVRW